MSIETLFYSITLYADSIYRNTNDCPLTLVIYLSDVVAVSTRPFIPPQLVRVPY